MTSIPKDISSLWKSLDPAVRAALIESESSSDSNINYVTTASYGGQGRHALGAAASNTFRYLAQIISIAAIIIITIIFTHFILISPINVAKQVNGVSGKVNSSTTLFDGKVNSSTTLFDGLGGNHHQSCDQLLNTSDSIFDRRRKVRQDILLQNASKLTFGRERTKFDAFEPEAVCFTDERFGSIERYNAFGDGPKFVCGVDILATKAKSNAGCLVYSVGSNNQVDFERGVKQFIGCETHTFDPTLKKPFVGGEYATFHPWGLGLDGVESSGNGKTWTGMSLEHIIQKLGHVNQTIDILKIDCEGCEWTVLPPFFELIASGMIQVDQLQVELHQQSNTLESISNFFLAADKAKLRIFHKERNHWGCSGYKCVEYSFISESFLREANRAAICPL